MLDLRDPKEVRAFEEAEAFCHTAQGMNFCLIMRDENGDLSIHKRENQPCQGGEMRKYGTTHKDCTRPDDRRPTDLHNPFPDGIPEAVSVRFNSGLKMTDDLFDQIVGEKSPYRKAGKSAVPVYHKRFKDMVVGAVFLDTDVDPTLFVNMLQFIKSSAYHTWDTMMESGVLKYDEVVPIMMLANPAWMISYSQPTAHNYYFPVNSAVHRIMTGDFTDLTGGTFRNRYDYNRPEIQDLFKAIGDETSTNFCKELAGQNLYKITKNKEFPYGKVECDVKEILEACRGILWSAVHKEEKRLALIKKEKKVDG